MFVGQKILKSLHLLGLTMYEIKNDEGIYQASHSLDQLLSTVSLDEIRKFGDSVKERFREFYQKTIQESLEIQKEGLKTNKKFGIPVAKESYKKLEKEEQKIEEKVEKYLQNLKPVFDSEYKALLIYIHDQISKTGWFLSNRIILQKGSIQNNCLKYSGKNFEVFDTNSFLKGLWKAVLLEYFQLLDKYNIGQ